jgi:hypothetical protein
MCISGVSSYREKPGRMQIRPGFFMHGDIRKVEKTRTIQNGNNPGDAVDEYRHP